jgi:hypothetical protein
LIFINDIADDMLGLCRLFADDTSVGERSLEINSLCSMVNIDLNNIKHWAKQWLVELNPEKTEIVYFSTRPSPVDLYFSTDNIKIKPVDAHKHIGVTLSVDGKWSKHINNVVVKSSRQIAVLCKIKVKVSRNLLENIYMTFIRPLLEYSCEVWDSCTAADAGRLKQLQLEAARIVTGLTAYNASLSSLYAKTGWEKLYTRRKIRKLSLFYNIIKGDTPDYLSDLQPQTVNQTNNYNLQNANNFTIPQCRLTLYQNSFFPATILWNNLPQYIRDSPSNCILKSRLKTYYNNPVKPPKYFSFGSRLASILHTRLRQNCSSLKGDLFRCNLIDSCYCYCDNYVENS